MRALVILLTCIITTQVGCSRSVHQKDFASADEAVEALVAAARSNDSQALLEVLGEDAKPVVSSGDAVQDENSRAQFVESYTQAHTLNTNAEGPMTLEVGEDQWPFPFPIVQQDGRWKFNSKAGTEEVLNRRVGANELATIQSCLAFVDAQREYYMLNPERDPLLHYSNKLISTEGRKDGLYWPGTSEDVPSPLGEEFARARSEGYFNDDAKLDASRAMPFHGYVYRLLESQGPDAPGGAYHYLVRDKMLGGFALIASPAEYGNSGVMTFLVNHDGVVYSKDLGEDTAKAALSIDTFNPDSSWQREASIE